MVLTRDGLGMEAFDYQVYQALSNLTVESWADFSARLRPAVGGWVGGWVGGRLDGRLDGRLGGGGGHECPVPSLGACPLRAGVQRLAAVHCRGVQLA